MKSLIIAEKPSLAKEYKSMLEKNTNEVFLRKDGYFESNNYYISWCFGHLVTLADPSEYGWEEWTLSNLPMIPVQWKYKIKSDTGAKKQFKTLKSLITKSSLVINGADPDREGELIVRLVLHLSGNSKIEQKRFWSRSLTHKDLTSAWNTMKPSKYYNNLYSSASCRQRADWLVGMNLSRAYSIKSGVKGISVGRVQTPTLNMIVQRDLEIENWKQSFYREIHGEWKGIPMKYIGDEIKNSSQEFVTEQEFNQADTICSQLKNKEFKVHSLKPTKKTQHPPLFYNLADIQKDANATFGFTADQTLSLVQSLYEKKILSYPRTDCNYLTEDTRQESLELLKKLVPVDFDASLINNSIPKSFNSKKVTAHTALVPVSVADESILNDNELKIYNLAVKRFILAQLEPSQTIETTLILSADGHYFKGTHREMVIPGYNSFLNDIRQTKPFPSDIDQSSLSAFTSIKTLEFERTKPKPYTESTLLSAMENCAKSIEDKDLKDTLKRVEGIGTPATRSNIIETLKFRKYIERKGKSLISTEKGRSVVQVVDTQIKSPSLTAEWEQLLHDIESGQLEWKHFYSKIVSYTDNVVSTVLNTDVKIETPETKQHKCPSCNLSTLSINKAGAFCSSCDLKFWRKQYGKTLTDKSFSDLLFKGKTSKLTFKSKANKKYQAVLKRDGEFNVKLDF